MMFRSPIFLVTLVLAAVSVSVVVVATNAALLEEIEQAQESSSSSAHARRVRVRAANNYDTTTRGVGRRELKKDKKTKNPAPPPPPPPPPKKKSKAGKSKTSASSKKKNSKRSKKSRTSRPTPAPTPNVSPPTPAPTSIVSADTAVLVAAPPGQSKEDIEQELTAQVVATLGLGPSTGKLPFGRRARERARQLQHPHPHPTQQRKLDFEEIIEDGDTLTAIQTVATVIDCQEIFIPPAPQPINVEVCYRATFTLSLQSTESTGDAQLVVDAYILTIDYSVKEGVFTEELQYIVVKEGSTDITGVPTTSPTTAPVAPTVSREYRVYIYIYI